MKHIHVEVSERAFGKLEAEARRRIRLEGRAGKKSYPHWKIIQDLLNTLPEPEGEEETPHDRADAISNRVGA